MTFHITHRNDEENEELKTKPKERMIETQTTENANKTQIHRRKIREEKFL